MRLDETQPSRPLPEGDAAPTRTESLLASPARSPRPLELALPVLVSAFGARAGLVCSFSGSAPTPGLAGFSGLDVPLEAIGWLEAFLRTPAGMRAFFAAKPTLPSAMLEACGGDDQIAPVIEALRVDGEPLAWLVIFGARQLQAGLAFLERLSPVLGLRLLLEQQSLKVAAPARGEEASRLFRDHQLESLRAATLTKAWGLTPQQTRAMSFVARGYSNRELAEFLGCAGKTAEAHVAALLQKSGAPSRAALVARYWTTEALENVLDPQGASGIGCAPQDGSEANPLKVLRIRPKAS